jgi:peptidoglycan/LPS O-acetylase OafA/YrhL
MPGSLGNVMSAAHWALALQTGLVTGVLALVLSFTPIGRLYGNRWGNALLVGALTAFADAWSHPNNYGFWHAEALLTGLVSALIVLAGSFLFEDRARRLRAVWARWRPTT